MRVHLTQRYNQLIPNGMLGTVMHWNIHENDKNMIFHNGTIEENCMAMIEQKLVVGDLIQTLKNRYPPILILFDNGMEVAVNPRWLRLEHPLFRYIHVLCYPLTAAYAETIYWSAGKTLEHVSPILDRGFLARGLFYVAISRVSSIKNLYLHSPLDIEQIVKPADEISRFYSNLQLRKSLQSIGKSRVKY